MRRPLAATVLTAALTAALTACSGGDAPSAQPTPTSAPTTSQAPPPTATPAPEPAVRACYRLAYDEAVAPTSDHRPVDCDGLHTSVTFAVGQLDTVVGGHLLAVDSERVQAQPAAACPDRLATYLGGALEDRRLSMLRAVWFTPDVAASDAGASWYRCDVVALASEGRLAPLKGRLAGVLDRPEERDRYAMCGTAEPGTAGFDRVICSAEHSWRAIAVVPFDQDTYPGAKQVRAAGEGPCQDAGAQVAESSLDYQWGYEWPTAEQWAAGQHYGRCWAPD